MITILFTQLKNIELLLFNDRVYFVLGVHFINTGMVLNNEISYLRVNEFVSLQ
jgi:hypothetical protein